MSKIRLDQLYQISPNPVKPTQKLFRIDDVDIAFASNRTTEVKEPPSPITQEPDSYPCVPSELNPGSIRVRDEEIIAIWQSQTRMRQSLSELHNTVRKENQQMRVQILNMRETYNMLLNIWKYMLIFSWVVLAMVVGFICQVDPKEIADAWPLIAMSSVSLSGATIGYGMVRFYTSGMLDGEGK